MEHRYYTCTTAGAYKFWEIYCDVRVNPTSGLKLYTVSVRYGRIGSKGRDEVIESFHNMTDAVTLMRQRENQKLAKGYVLNGPGSVTVDDAAAALADLQAAIGRLS